MKKNLNVRIDEDLLKKYKKFCKNNKFSISDRVRSFIEEDLKKELSSDKLANDIISKFEKLGIKDNVDSNKMELFTKAIVNELIEVLQKDMKITIKSKLL